jgi:hypothetical protein
MGQMLRRGAVVLGFVLALAPLSAFADGNQDVINANKAAKAALDNMTPMQQGVALGQAEIANARAIAKMLYWDGHAQTEIPNSMQQYNEFCGGAIQSVQGMVANGNAMVMARPWDLHAQAELANAKAMQQQLWAIIGDTYPGNPYYVENPSGVGYTADDGAVYADDGEDMVADDSVIASDDMAFAGDDAALVADDGVDATATE